MSIGFWRRLYSASCLRASSKRNCGNIWSPYFARSASASAYPLPFAVAGKGRTSIFENYFKGALFDTSTDWVALLQPWILSDLRFQNISTEMAEVVDKAHEKAEEKTENGGVNGIAEATAHLENINLGKDGAQVEKKNLHVVFVLGGPGSGKGTQCANIVDNFGFTHLSAGDLLRAEIKSGSENGTMIENMIKEGKIVPSEVTVNLLEKAMRESGNNKFLIDGFPRNEENRAAFETVTGIEPDFILFFDCPEEEMEKRLLGRNEGRVDDNIETIRKRFKVFIESSIPVVNYYDTKGKVRKVDAAKPKEEVFDDVKLHFAPFSKEQDNVKKVQN